MKVVLNIICAKINVGENLLLLKGRVLQANKSSKYYKRTNIVAGLFNNKSIASCVYNGSCNT